MMVKYFCDSCEKPISIKQGTEFAEIVRGDIVLKIHVLKIEEGDEVDRLFLCLSCLADSLHHGYLRQ